MPPTTILSSGLTITNPLVLYRTLLALRKIEPDPAQHRLALELQKVYHRLKDYSPEQDYGARLKAISRAVEEVPKVKDQTVVAVPGHPLRRNPLFAHLFPKDADRDIKALTRILTSHEAAMNLGSPKGLLLHGEVGTGKSMLLDLLADSLPNPKKKRWHFNTFMLEILSRLEHLRKIRPAEDSEYSMVWLAKEMIDKSPILFLDEFQLPDRAASKILSNLLTPFFQLGGVLIASSNRMPDELAKASGMDFTAPARGGFVRSWLGLSGGSLRSKYQANNEYGQFVDVLKARCDIWDMNGGRDWRRREVEAEDHIANEVSENLGEEILGDVPGLEMRDQNNVISEKGILLEEELLKSSMAAPRKYFLVGSSDGLQWGKAIRALLPPDMKSPIPWKSTTFQVYGRKVDVPKHAAGVVYFSFPSLCGGLLGPADYITLASTFHTLVLDEVPVLTTSQKNEARRFITLLDALYEARCKLLIRAHAGPDDIFFPEMKATETSSSTVASGASDAADTNESGDAVYPETLSEIYQDQTSPFRPNVSYYTNEPKAGYDPDEDSSFGLVPGEGSESGHRVDFGMTSSFTGEDERFAYKRASSRLWEMCGSCWHNRSEPGWWKPLSLENRRWENSSTMHAPNSRPLSSIGGEVKLGESTELDKPAGLQGKMLEEMIHPGPFRPDREPAQQIAWTHAWGMIKWGGKAGIWGQGPDGLSRKNK
ncbi:AFG1-like ATPase-domain-containing protein [Bisporella sp. PMI_857]|nr:AFG1-like ATPase-domain-containing protein [Bisporella sp. PMI_857]